MVGLGPSGAGVATEARRRGGETPVEPEEVRGDLKLADEAHKSLVKVALPA